MAKEKTKEQKLKHEVIKGWIVQLSAVLFAVSAFLMLLGGRFEFLPDFSWFDGELINGFIELLYAVAGLGIVSYGIWRNNYAVTEKAKQDYEKLLDEEEEAGERDELRG